MHPASHFSNTYWLLKAILACFHTEQKQFGLNLKQLSVLKALPFVSSGANSEVRMQQVNQGKRVK